MVIVFNRTAIFFFPCVAASVSQNRQLHPSAGVLGFALYWSCRSPCSEYGAMGDFAWCLAHRILDLTTRNIHK